MKTKLYIDKGEPLFSCWPETLSDGSEVWNIYIRGGEVLHFASEEAADEALCRLEQAVELSMSEALVL